MSRLSISLLLLISLVSIATSTASPSTPKPKRTPYDFIKVSCSATRYPLVCIRSLSIYASKIQQSPKQIAQAALSVSLSRARSATTFVSQMSKAKGMKAREYRVVKDCVDNMGDSVDRLGNSIKELMQIGRGSQDFVWHMSNVQTWVSAALTDENTCVDGFAGRAMNGKVKAAVRSRVVNVAQLTSNALALINRFAATHY